MADWLLEYLPTLVKENLGRSATANMSAPATRGSSVAKTALGAADLAAGAVGMAAKKLMERESNVASSVYVFPILPKRTDEAKRIVQKLKGPRKQDHEESRRNLGITKERMWIQHMPDQDLAIMYHEAENLDPVLQGLVESKDPLDLWIRDQLTVQGLDPSQLTAEPLFTWPSTDASPSTEIEPVPSQSPW